MLRIYDQARESNKLNPPNHQSLQRHITILNFPLLLKLLPPLLQHFLLLLQLLTMYIVVLILINLKEPPRLAHLIHRNPNLHHSLFQFPQSPQPQTSHIMTYGGSCLFFIVELWFEGDTLF